jgi:DNA polymerase III delta prime subunit
MNLHAGIRETLNYFHREKKIPHIVFHGSAGSGKRTLVHYFLVLIYGEKRAHMKDNIMYVNCAQGKGIKFIRDELKAFSKINIQNRQDFPFKSIILLNADFLTIDAQSALRRCIELFSTNTRFFIVVENKNKLLNPILSRFCEIHVPEFARDGHRSIHQYMIHETLPAAEETARKRSLVGEIMMMINVDGDHGKDSMQPLIQIATRIYETGLSALDLVDFIATGTSNHDLKTRLLMHFHVIRSQHRCEKMLILAVLHKLRNDTTY